MKIKDNQYGPQNSKSIKEPLFCIRLLQQKYKEYGRKLHIVLIDFEKAYETVFTDLIWYCLKNKNVPEAFIDIIKDMYEHSTNLVSATVGKTENFFLNFPKIFDAVIIRYCYKLEYYGVRGVPLIWFQSYLHNR